MTERVVLATARHATVTTARNVGEHLVALGFVASAEHGWKFCAEHFEAERHDLPWWLLVAAAILIYVAGLFSARLILTLISHYRAERAVARLRAAKRPIIDLPRPTLAIAGLDATDKMALALFGSAFVAGLSVVVALRCRPSA